MNKAYSQDSLTTMAPTPTQEISQIDILTFLPAAWQPAWQTIAQYPLLGALAISMAFLIAAVLVRYLLLGSLQRMAIATNAMIDNIVIDHLRKPVFTTISCFGFALAVQVARLPVATEFLINVLLSIIVASWMRSAFHLSGRILGILSNNHRFSVVEPRTVPLLDLSIRLLVILLGSYCLLMIWGINPMGWLASAGIVGIAVGFAAKDTLANLFSGFFILVDSPYKIGDYINLDSGERGRVSHIGLRSTRLLSREDMEITLPNAVIANAKIVNESGGPSANIRIAMPVGVAYGSDVDATCRVLLSIGENHPEICDDPPPRVRMRAFGPSSLDFELLGWIQKPEDRGRIRHEILMAIYKALKEEGIEIPYSKSDVYIKSFPDISRHSEKE